MSQNSKSGKTLKKSTVSDKAAASENLDRRNIFFQRFLNRYKIWGKVM